MFVYSLQTLSCNAELTAKQSAVAWLALAINFWIFARQSYSFAKDFQRMVETSKVELAQASRTDYEFYLLKVVTVVIVAFLISYKCKENPMQLEKTSRYLYVFLMNAAVELAFAYNLYMFDQKPTEAAIDNEIQARKEKARAKQE